MTGTIGDSGRAAGRIGLVSPSHYGSAAVGNVAVHELGIAQSIVQTVLEAMSREGYREVTAVGVRVGAMSDVVPDALEFGFQAAIQDTPLAGARLAIERVPIVASCGQCGREFPVEDFVFVCPNCGERRNIALAQGDELEIAYIEVEDDPP